MGRSRTHEGLAWRFAHRRLHCCLADSPKCLGGVILELLQQFRLADLEAPHGELAVQFVALRPGKRVTLKRSEGQPRFRQGKDAIPIGKATKVLNKYNLPLDESRYARRLGFFPSVVTGFWIQVHY